MFKINLDLFKAKGVIKLAKSKFTKSIKKETRLKFLLFFFLVILVALGEYFTIGESGLFAKKLLGLEIESQKLKVQGKGSELITNDVNMYSDGFITSKNSDNCKLILLNYVVNMSSKIN